MRARLALGQTPPCGSRILGAAGDLRRGFRRRVRPRAQLRREVVSQKNEAERQRIEADQQRQAAEARRTEAESERDNVQAVVNFLTDDVLAKASPKQSQNQVVRDILVRTLLEPAAATVGSRFQDKPGIEALVRSTIAETMLALGRADLALTHVERALDLYRQLLGEDHPYTILTLHNYANVMKSLGRAKDAERVLKQALQQRRELLGEDDPATIESLNSYAQVLQALGRAQEAEPLQRQVLEQSRRVLGNEDPNTITVLNNYAGMLESLGRAREAEPLFKQALELSKQDARRRAPRYDHFLEQLRWSSCSVRSSTGVPNRSSSRHWIKAGWFSGTTIPRLSLP